MVFVIAHNFLILNEVILGNICMIYYIQYYACVFIYLFCIEYNLWLQNITFFFSKSSMKLNTP